MAVCNIFNELKKTTGTFLTFSQYTVDLTKEMSHTMSTRVVPSKFVALNIDYSAIKTSGSYKFTNYSLPKYLRDRFENGCAIGRNSGDWKSYYSTNLFWNTLYDLGLISINMDTDNSMYVDEIKYVGDINIESYNEYEGMGYSELYCHIPNNATEKRYHCIKNSGEDFEMTSNHTIEGYGEIDLGAGAYVSDHPLTYTPYTVIDGDKRNTFEFSWDDIGLKTSDIRSDSFQFNTIIVLYDLYIGDEIHKSIPMGVYFTGLLSNGVMQNSITKFVSNDAIYNTGTSYGLRICTRFISHPGTDELIVSEMTIPDNGVGEISTLLGKMSETHVKMDNILHNMSKINQPNKDLLAIFKNSRTNVPYIKDVNGTSHWFVNGRMLSNTVEMGNCSCESYTPGQMHDFVNRIYSLKVDVIGFTNTGNRVINRFTNDSIDVYLYWSVGYRDQQTIPDKLEIGVSEDGGDTIWTNLDKTSTGLTLTNVSKNTSYSIRARKDGKEATDNTEVIFVYPSFFGLIPCECEIANTEKDDVSNHNIQLNEEDIKSLDQYTYLPYENQTYTYTNIDAKSHICLAYPKSYNKVQSIVDIYGQNYTDDFYRLDMEINNVPYYVYVDRAPSFVKDYTLQFRFNEI